MCTIISPVPIAQYGTDSEVRYVCLFAGLFWSPSRRSQFLVNFDGILSSRFTPAMHFNEQVLVPQQYGLLTEDNSSEGAS